MDKRKALRVAYLCQQTGIHLDGYGGAAVHVLAIIQNLRRMGHHVTFVSPKLGRQISLSNGLDVKSARLRLTGTSVFKWFESGVRRAQSALHLPYLALFDSLRFYDACTCELEGYDIFHERFSMLGIGGTLAAQHLNIPLLLEVNADFLDELDSIGQGPRGIQRLAVRWASALCFQRAVAIVAVSNQLKTHLVNAWGLPANKITVLPNGADIEQFDPNADPSTARARLGLADVPSVIFVGGFFPWHAPLDLIDSFAMVHQQMPEAHLYLVGDGPMHSQARAHANQLELNDSVIFAGRVLHKHIQDWLAAADVAVAPFTHFSPGKGGSPLKLFEYMAAGKAIVASATGQVKEIIQHNKTGLLVKPGDNKKFSEAILKLLRDQSLRSLLGQAAQQEATSQHTWRQYVEQLISIYQQNERIQ